MELEPGVREALDEVHALGEQDKLEHLIVLRAGKVVARETGDEQSVSFGNVALEAGDIVVHNHPNSVNALSNVDAMQIFYNPLKAMYAISGDKSVYKVEVGSMGMLNPDRFLFTTEALMLMVRDRAQTQSRLGDDNVNRVLQDAEERNVGPAHWINRMLDKAGALKYSYELAPESATMVAKLDNAIRWDEFME